jgi:hypothetical protein
MTNDLQVISVKLPRATLRQISGNRSDFVRQAVAEKLSRQPPAPWKPKTSQGRKLLKLRQGFIERGGELLDAKGIAEELRQRRGGVQ